MLEEMMKRMSILERVPPREPQNNFQSRNRNQNFRRENNQDRQRDNDQQIRPPFQKNYVDQEEEREIECLGENHVNLIGSDGGDDVFLTEEEQGFFSLEPKEDTYEESEDYRLGFENAIMEVHKHNDLRSKGNIDSPNDKNTSSAVRKNT